MAEDTQPAAPAQTTGSGQGAANGVAAPVMPTPVAATTAPVATPAAVARPMVDVIEQVVGQIRESTNVLIALSKDPNVDELAAAIGLTFLLDKMGKHATAIFSGAVPNAIEFLEPEKTFEANTNSLQDFIIALDKEKADHLRYKIEGDYVKVFITPYKTTIDEKDLEFSHGELNVDLVLSLDVADVADLDRALERHGRILHDASGVNMTIGVPGKFGDVEWSDPAASSVCEMVGVLAERLQENELLMDKAIATALLAGIVAATSRFSNERTTPATMELASKLMAAGADQQLISASISPETGAVDMNEVAGLAKVAEGEGEKEATDDATKLKVEHDDEELGVKSEVLEDKLAKSEENAGLTPEEQLEKIIQAPKAAVATTPILEELKMAQPSEETKPEESTKPAEAQPEEPMKTAVVGEKTIAPIDDGVDGVPSEAKPDYAAMMEAELKTPLPVEVEQKMAPVVPSEPVVAQDVVNEPAKMPLPMPNTTVDLPPPPPPFDPSVAATATAKPADPGAFKLPTMPQ